MSCFSVERPEDLDEAVQVGRSRRRTVRALTLMEQQQGAGAKT